MTQRPLWPRTGIRVVGRPSADKGVEQHLIATFGPICVWSWVGMPIDASVLPLIYASCHLVEGMV